MKTYLQVKIASLAEEAKIIRKKEHAAITSARYAKRHNQPDCDIQYKLYFELNAHRRFAVRGESRCAQLALGYLRARAYSSMERKCYEQPNWLRVAELVIKYGDSLGMEKKGLVLELQEWSKGKPSLYEREKMRA